MSEREIVADRLREVGVATDQRFIDVRDGEKKSVSNHHEPSNRYDADGVEGNYGIYASAADELAILDVDDYGDLDDESGLEALERHIPTTLTQESPHGGEHLLLRVEPSEDGRLVAAALEEVFGVKNPQPSWGEVRTANQYVVGAGSQLEGCDKEWCDNCATEDGGRYALANDVDVASIPADRLIGTLLEDPALSKDEDDAPEPSSAKSPAADDYDLQERLELARETDDKLNRLMDGDYSDYRDASASGGVDRSAAESALAAKLGWWLGNDKREVARVMDRYARTLKWDERTDDSYRDSILDAVNINNDCYDPSRSTGSQDPPSNIDWSEVERADAIQRSQTTHEEPIGVLEHHHGCYGVSWQHTDEDGNVTEQGVETVANFTIETLAFLETEEGTEFILRVHPNSPLDESFDVRVEPTVFNSVETFKDEIVVGKNTTFDTNAPRQGIPSSTIMASLRETVGSQPAPHREGWPHIGLSEDMSEFVTPVGSLTGEGWAEDPEYRFYTKAGDGDDAGALPQKWRLDPEDDIDVDEDAVARICELLPRIREPERGVPMLGWFYAAPLKPHIHEWEDEFPLLSPHGDTGSGKTSAIRTFMKAFGGDGEPFSAADTSFTVEKHVSESRGFPVWLDEYKPTEMDDRRLKRLHRVLKKVTKEATLPKGTPDLGEVTLHLRAPVILSGEQKIEDPAVQRRAIITNLSQAAARDGTSTKEAFGELTGTAYEDADGEQHYPEGMDLLQHARAYYQWILEWSEEDLRSAWQTAREKVKDILSDFGVTVEESEQRGLQTIVFGVAIYRAFATAHGADEADLVSDRDVREACSHVVENIGVDGQRREHADEFLEVMTLAATEEYLEPDVHHRLLDSSAHECEVLAIHMPSAFSAVKRYVRDSNLEDDYSILSKTDYLNSFGNKADDPTSYVLATNKRTRGIDNGSKAVHFDHEAISAKLGSSFNADAFRPASEREDDGEGDVVSATPIADLEPTGNPYKTVTVKVTRWENGPENGPDARGTFGDATGVIDAVDFTGSEAARELEGDCYYRIENLRISTYDGTHQVELVDGVTDVTPIQAGVGYTSSEDPDDGDGDQVGLDEHTDEEAAADGGEPADLEGAKARVHDHLATEYERGDTVTVPAIAGETGLDPTEVETAVAALCERGDLLDTEDGYEVVR